MNLSEIRSEVRRMLAETSASASGFSDTDINQTINDAIKDMCIRGEVFTKSLTITVATTVATYTMPWDFIKPKTLLNHNSQVLDPIPLSSVGRVWTKTGYPLTFYFTQAAAAIPVWTNGAAKVVWPATCLVAATYVVPTVANGYMYECTANGTTGGSEPAAWGTTLGGTTADNTATWTCRELLTRLQTLNLYATPTTAGAGTGTYTMIYSARDEGLFSDTDTPNFPGDLHHIIIPFSVARCLLRARQAQDAVNFYNDYAGSLNLPLVSDPNKLAQETPQVRS